MGFSVSAALARSTQPFYMYQSPSGYIFRIKIPTDLRHLVGKCEFRYSLRTGASRLTDRDRTRLQSLFETGVLVVEKSGAGKKVVVKNRDALDAFVLRSYPSGLQGSSAILTPRSSGVAELRDSKKAHETGPLMVLLRGFDN